MAIDFSNAKLLTYDRRNEFFGEAFRYASKADLTIEGCIYALDNLEGVAPVWSGLSGFISSANDYDAIILNGTNFGSGRVNSLNFKESVDVRLKEYTANLTVYQTGNLYNLSGLYYSGLNFFNDSNNPIHLTDTFNENFEFNIKDDGSYAYKQTVNLRFISGKMAGNSRSAIDMAKSFASGLLSSQVPLGFIDSVHSGWYTQSGRRTYTENYNLITNECSFTENFELDYPSGNYSIKYSHEINTDQDGVTNVTENGRIKGLYAPYAANAESGYVVEAGQAFDRCSGVMDFYVPSGYALAAAHVTSQKKINTILGEIEYGVTFTNDPRFNVDYIWEYTEQLDREQNSCFYRVTENGHIKGRDNNCTYSQKNENAINAYNIIVTGIAERLSGYYQSGTNLSNPLKLISSNKRHNPYTADIDYSATYADNLYYGISSGIKKIDYEIEDNQPIIKVNKFGIINAKEIVQSALIYTPGSYTCNIKVQGERGVSNTVLESGALAIVTGNVPTGIHYLDKASSSYAPNQSLYNLNVSWQYFKRN
jgi:hypothetical protein